MPDLETSNGRKVHMSSGYTTTTTTFDTPRWGESLCKLARTRITTDTCQVTCLICKKQIIKKVL